jgi:hypothetical protein
LYLPIVISNPEIVDQIPIITNPIIYNIIYNNDEAFDYRFLLHFECCKTSIVIKINHFNQPIGELLHRTSVTTDYEG